MFNAELVEKLKMQSTPFYYYDVDLLNRTLSSLKQAADRYAYRVHYALKANSNDRILSHIQQHGFGADCVSGNEVRKAMDLGFAPGDIVFAGVGKSDAEIQAGLKNRIHCFNCESIQELAVIDELAGNENVIAQVALRINPEIDAKTHHYITTGLQENKFGIYLKDLPDALARLQQLKNLNLIGLHFHIGSQVTSLEVFKSLCLRVNEIQKLIREKHIELQHLNLGGGLGVDYHYPDKHAIPDFESYFHVFKQFLEPRPGQMVHFELGRTLVAQCGSLISRVLYVKPGVTTKFAILDAGMTELIRPALYQAYHKIENLTNKGQREKYDVVGPICESSDCFGKAIMLPETRRGDLLAIRSTGAYGEVMVSRYNLRTPAPAIYSDEI